MATRFPKAHSPLPQMHLTADGHDAKLCNNSYGHERHQDQCTKMTFTWPRDAGIGKK